MGKLWVFEYLQMYCNGNNCYQPYNHLPDNGRPYVAYVSILAIPVSPLNMQGLFVTELLVTYSRA